jgi:hypothetical protein
MIAAVRFVGLTGAQFLVVAIVLGLIGLAVAGWHFSRTED